MVLSKFGKDHRGLGLKELNFLNLMGVSWSGYKEVW